MSETTQHEHTPEEYAIPIRDIELEDARQEARHVQRQLRDILSRVIRDLREVNAPPEVVRFYEIRLNEI